MRSAALVLLVAAAITAGCGYVRNEETAGTSGATAEPTTTITQAAPRAPEALTPDPAPTPGEGPAPAPPEPPPPDPATGFEPVDDGQRPVCEAMSSTQHHLYELFRLGDLEAYHAAARDMVRDAQIIRDRVPDELRDSADELVSTFEQQLAPIAAADNDEQLRQAVSGLRLEPVVEGRIGTEAFVWLLEVCPPTDA